MYLEETVLGDKVHGDVGVSTVGQEIEKSGEIDDNTEDKVDNARATVQDNSEYSQDRIKQKANIPLEQGPDLLHDGGEGAHVVLYEGLYC